MICQWESVLNVLPNWMRQAVDEQGSETLQELRLRLGQQPQLCMGIRQKFLQRHVNAEDLRFVIHAASRYSPWAIASAAQGYITLPGGHRIGISGEVIQKEGCPSTVRWASSVCIRISRDFSGISRKIHNQGSILIIGSPGSGKTSLLRDLIRCRSDTGPQSVCVIDERCELFPASQNSFCYPQGLRTDVILACPKAQGIQMGIRCMSPGTIAVDEITAPSDCLALTQAAWCGVDILATAHAGGKEELYRRAVYKPLMESQIFETLVIMSPDKTYYTERMAKQ